MAQYVFGDFLFSERDDSPLYSLSRSADGGWIEVELLNRLPMQQQTGRKLDKSPYGDFGLVRRGSRATTSYWPSAMKVNPAR